MRMNSWLNSLFVIVVLSGCVDTLVSDTQGQEHFQLRPIESFESLRWIGESDPKSDPILATVEGTPITVSMLKTQLERAPENTDPELLLERMIEFELLAREAFRSGKYTESVAGQAIKKALNQRWLIQTFTKDLTKDDIPTQLVEQKFNEVKSYFQHFERFKLLDVQTMCCMETGDQDNCFRDELIEVEDRRLRLKECLEHHGNSMKQLHQILSSPEATKDAEAFRRSLDIVATDFPSQQLRDHYGTSTTLNEYGFEYDVNASYEEQFEVVRYRIFFKEIMDAVRDTYLKKGRKTPFLTPPIRSPIGWHILYVHEVLPRQHRTLADPQVNAQVRDKLFNVWRSQLIVPQAFDKLCREQGCAPEFCTQLLSHWRCMERVRVSQGQTNHESIRQQCDSLLIVDLASDSGNCFYRGHRLVPLQQRQDKQ
jgi:hypothetical protein